MPKPLKILYFAGPGNVIQTFKYWHDGQDDPSQVSMTFSGQFYEICRALNAEGYVIASNHQRQFVENNQFTLEHRPVSPRFRSTAGYYLSHILYNLRIIYSAIKFQADVVIAADPECAFVFSLLPKVGIRIIPTFHCVLWPKYKPLGKLKKLLMKLNGHFLAKDCLAILSTSEDVNNQLKEISNYKAQPIFNFLSTYRRSEFAHVTLPERSTAKFNVLFAGRIERNKGVFDLLDIAKRFQADGKTHIVFHLCGVGSVLEALQAEVKKYHLEDSFVLHGYCNKPEMRKQFSEADVVIVPTQSGFVEGLNQVVIEGILSQRPVITSSVCPALHYVRDAVIEVPPDDIQAYGDAILELASNPDLYNEKQRSCEMLQEQFYNLNMSWGEALKSILLQWRPDLQQSVTHVPEAWALGIDDVISETNVLDEERVAESS